MRPGCEVASTEDAETTARVDNGDHSALSRDIEASIVRIEGEDVGIIADPHAPDHLAGGNVNGDKRGVLFAGNVGACNRRFDGNPVRAVAAR